MSERITQLRDAINVVEQLEELDEPVAIGKARSLVGSASEQIHGPDYEMRIEEAMAEAAGTAANVRRYDIADAALAVVEDSDEREETIEKQAYDVIERSADDRGRVNLGTTYADADVTVAVLDVTVPGEDDEDGEQWHGAEQQEDT